MTINPFSPDDPRITAYLLGELNDAERAEVDALLAQDPAAQQALLELMELTGSLAEALAMEPLPSLHPDRRDAVLATMRKVSEGVEPLRNQVVVADAPARPSRLWWGAGAVAACCVMGLSILFAARDTAKQGPQYAISSEDSSEFDVALQIHPESEMRQEIASAFHDFDGLAEVQQNAGAVRHDADFGLESLAKQAGDKNRMSGPTDEQVEFKYSPASPAPQSAPAEPNLAANSPRYSLTPLGGAGTDVSASSLAAGSGGQAATSVRVRQMNAGTVTMQNGEAGASSQPVAPVIVDSFSANSAGVVHKPQPTPFPGATPVEPSIPLVSQNTTHYWSAPEGTPAAPRVVSDNLSRKAGRPALVAGQQNGQASGQGQATSLASNDDLSAMPPSTSPAGGESPDPAALGQLVSNGVVTNNAVPLHSQVPALGVTDLKRTESLGRDMRLGDAKSPADGNATDNFSLESSLAMRGGRNPERELEERLSEHDGWGFRVKGRILDSSVPGTESYAPIVENEFVTPNQSPFSTFGVDVDTAAYSNIRRFLDGNQWPPANAVRLEELINAFEYSVPAPTEEHPVNISAEAAFCPWQPAHQLVRVSVKGREINREDRPATSLVFLIDKSGSMSDANKLPLLKDSLRLLVEELHEQDRVSIVTYANGADLVLEGATANDRTRIMHAIDSLNANGSTNGEAGLNLAYEVAMRNRITEGSNRILVCTDGDFNVGNSADDVLFRMIGEKKKSNIFLSILGFGTGNIKDSKLEGIADHGNGQYMYIDGLREARRVLVEQLTGTLYTIAKDVKLQVEFNPAKVSYYRLLGYENRTLAAEDFNNDAVDAGDMGAGHTVTALYEIVPAGVEPQGVATVDDSRYSAPKTPAEKDPQDQPMPETNAAELLFVKLRYKQPTGDQSVKIDLAVNVPEDGAQASNDLQWAANVASFGLLLRESKFKGNANWDDLLSRTRQAIGSDPTGQRRNFADMVFRARSLWKRAHGESYPEPTPLATGDARQKATCDGKYADLLDKLEIPEDYSSYGQFIDFGKWQGNAYKGHTNLPEGYWVYVYPNWYIWGEVRE